MKLAEALQERADLNRTIRQLSIRLQANALVQDGENAAEDPAELKRSLDACVERLALLTARINHTNCATKAGGRTLTEIIAQKDALAVKIQAYKDMVVAASQASDRARGTEIKILPTVKVSEWQKEIDGMSKQYRELDNLLQQSNWQYDLV